jgi:hypothetical protein
MGNTRAIGGRSPIHLSQLRVGRNARRWEDFPRRQFLHLAAGAAGLPAVSQIATTQTYVRIV